MTEPGDIDAAEAFLRAFHERHPYATVRAFGSARTAAGHSSYDLLLEELPAEGAVLDLGCGDGYLLERIAAAAPGVHLVGVDITAVDLERAAARPALRGATLLCERAQELSIATASIDAVRSHMALMLMADVAGVVGEIRRVLRPGGRVAAVVGAGMRGANDALDLFLDLWRPVFRAEAGRSPVLVNALVRSADALRSAFSEGFSECTVEDHVLDHSGGVDAVWEVASLMYNADLVSGPGLASVEAAFRERAPDLARPDGSIPLLTSIRLLRATRA